MQMKISPADPNKMKEQKSECIYYISLQTDVTATQSAQLGARALNLSHQLLQLHVNFQDKHPLGQAPSNNNRSSVAFQPVQNVLVSKFGNFRTVARPLYLMPLLAILVHFSVY